MQFWHKTARNIFRVGTVAALLPLTGCARTPANSQSGTRMIVTLRFNGPVNPNYQYFFLIRNASDQTGGQNGPIPVIAPPYLNGFATGVNNATAAFTDFVVYGNARQLGPSGYSLYHLKNGIAGDSNNPVNFLARGEPVLTTPPAGGNLLQFQIDLTQIKPDSTDPAPTDDQRPRYLQINVIATTTTPTSSQSVDPQKFLDAFGDQSSVTSGTFNKYITIDTSQNRTYQNTDSSDLTEPTNDTYPGTSDPGIELIAWSIQVVNR